MAGRHGKLSNSPYHVITKRDLASEKYNNEYQHKNPPCKYRKNGQVCDLPQNKLRYKKICVSEKCRYLNKTNSQLRTQCAFLIRGKCSKKLLNCTKDEDLAYCCDYFLSIENYSHFHQQLETNDKYNRAYSTLIENVKNLKKKQKNFERKIKSYKNNSLNKRIYEINKQKQVLKGDVELLLPNVLEFKNANEQKSIFKLTINNLKNIEMEFMWFDKFIDDNQQWMSSYINGDVEKYKSGINSYRKAKEQYLDALENLLMVTNGK